MTSCPCRSPPRASTAGRLNWLPAAQSAIIRLLRHQEAGHVDARPRQIGRPGDPDRDWLASRRVHGSTWNGKQHLWIGQKPEVLEVLREQAIIQSAESSNRIEGVTVAANRLSPLVIGRARPRDRSEDWPDIGLRWIGSSRERTGLQSLPTLSAACTLFPRADLPETPANGRNATTRSSKSCRVASAA